MPHNRPSVKTNTVSGVKLWYISRWNGEASTWWNGEASTWCYGDHAEYLHNDGVWRESTFNRKYDGISSEEKFTGYYKTQEAAMDAMTTWMSTSSDFPVDKTLLVVDKDTACLEIAV